MSNLARKLVSKKKRRFMEGGFDLDLTYITDSIIAMGFPSEKIEGMFRNPMSEVVRFLDSRHPDHYKVYNLCSERTYDPSKFHGRVAHYAFDDHNAPPIELFKPFCNDVYTWLTADPKNVVVIHCKAGKGRTGVMISAYLMHCGLWPTAEQALEFYGALRTKNKKGVTIPSQRRYVVYYETMLREKIEPQKRTLLLAGVRLYTVPRFNVQNSSSPFFTVSIKEAKVYTSKAVEGLSKDLPYVDMVMTQYVPLVGDVRVEFYHRKGGGAGHGKMFHFWFNTYFVRGTDKLVLRKDELDKANKDRGHKLFDENLAVELKFIDPEQDPLVMPMPSSHDSSLAVPASAPSAGHSSRDSTGPPASSTASSATHDHGARLNGAGLSGPACAVVSASSLNNVGVDDEDLSDTDEDEIEDS